MTTWVKLLGHQSDLEALARNFPTGEPRVLLNKEGAFMLSTAIDPVFRVKPDRMVAIAQEELDLLNGWCTYQDSSYRNVRLQTAFHRFNSQDEEEAYIVGGDEGHGRESMTIVMPETAYGRLTVGVPTLTVTGGVPVEPPPPPGPGLLARNDPNVRDLLAILGKSQQQLSWAELYKCFEIIRDAVGGGRKGIAAKGWTTVAELSRFTGTADHPAASGIHDGRHARQGGPPPKNTMTLDEAQAFIRDLARHWLDSLS